MRYIALIVLVGIVGISAFGFLGMGHTVGHEADCVASVINNGAICPEKAISSAFYHVAAYKSFSETTLPGTALALFAALLVLATLEWVRARAPALYFEQTSNASSDRRSAPIPQKKFLRWCSRFERSPSYA